MVNPFKLNKRFIQVAGYAVSAILLFVIFRTLYDQRDQFEGLEINQSFFLVTFLAVGVVAIGNILNTLANKLLLSHTHPSCSLPLLFSINGLSQLGKYLPGNILHLVGRYFLLKHYTNAKDAFYFSIYEIVLLLIVGVSIGVFYGFYLQLIPVIGLMYFVLALACLLSGLGLVYYFNLLTVPFQTLLSIASLYLLSFVLYGFAFFCLFESVFEVSSDVLICTVLFALSFLVGYVTPGASGGLGVREYAFMLLATPLIDPTIALAAIVLFRVYTIVGDLVFAGIAMLIKRKFKVVLIANHP